MTRMMSPDGILGQVPEENVAAAKDAGFRVMTSDHMKDMYNRLFLEHALFQDQKKKSLQNLKKRTATRMRGRS